MRKSKFGFTLGEVLVSLAVIGVIMALAAHTIKLAKSSYTAVTYHAFNNVAAIVGEVLSGERTASVKDEKGNENNIPLAHMVCRTSADGLSTTILAPDYRSNTNPLCSQAGNPSVNGGNGTPDTLFCKNTVYFANTKGTPLCDYKDHLDVEFNSTTKEPTITKTSMDSKWASPNFIATNGYRYYFSKWTYNTNVSSTYGFRIIAVDVNGSNGPNTMTYDPNTEVLPDIVQFVVLDNGEIYPVGPAGNNLTVRDKTVTYLNARVKGYYYKHDETRTNNVPESCIVRNADGSSSRTCNFAALYSINSKGNAFFSYKEALCYSIGNTVPTYVHYCDDYPIEEENLCPPSTNAKRFDECSVKIVKPAFRYNFK